MAGSIPNNNSNYYREAADKVWEMAKDYEKKGLKELSETLKDIAQDIHDLARQKLLDK